MPQTRRRRRSGRPQQLQSMESLATGQHASVTPPGAVWKWRTFPVYFAFALGAFVGVWGGILAGAVNSDVQYLVFLGVSTLLGLGLSRITTRWMVSRRWIRARQPRAAR